MKNNTTLFRDTNGYVGLISNNGSDLSVLDNKDSSSGEQLTEADKNRISHLIEQERTETLEHCNLMFKIRAPLFVAREHMSLQGWVFNHDNIYHADANTKFYEPGAYRSEHRHGFEQSVINPVLQDKVKLGRFRVYRTTRALGMHHESALRLYKHMREAGICKEQSMAVLPQNVYVEYCASANLHDVLKFAMLVDDSTTLPELRELAQGVLQISETHFPSTTNIWLRSTRKRQANVAQRLGKLKELIDMTEKLNFAQHAKIEEVKTYLKNKGELENETRNISEGEQGTGSTEDPKESRRKARWRFWSKDEGGG